MSENKIHPSAIIGANVQLGARNEIGPHVILEDGVKIGSGNKLLSGAQLCTGTTLGDENTIHMRAIIGNIPQDLVYGGEESYTKMGSKNTIREFVTIHRGTKAGSSTVLGNENFLMAYAHVAHNCEIGNNVIMVNQASLTGYCTVEDRAFLSGMTGFHQFSKIGTLSLVSALSACNKDIPPFFICGGRPGVALGINVVGLRRAGVTAEVRNEIKDAFRLLYRSGLNVSQALDAIKAQSKSKEAKHLITFIEKSKRGIIDGSGEETLKAKKTSTPTVN